MVAEVEGEKQVATTFAVIHETSYISTIWQDTFQWSPTKIPRVYLEPLSYAT